MLSPRSETTKQWSLFKQQISQWVGTEPWWLHVIFVMVNHLFPLSNLIKASWWCSLSIFQAENFLLFLYKHLYCLRKENMVSLRCCFLLVFCYTEMLIVHLFYITPPFVSEKERWGSHLETFCRAWDVFVHLFLLWFWHERMFTPIWWTGKCTDNGRR